MNTIELTPEFIDAVSAGASALVTMAEELQRNEHYNEDGPIGELVRKTVESNYQKVDLLRGWLVRIEGKEK